MTDLEKFSLKWDFRNFKGKLTDRAKQKQKSYEEILFSIYKHHKSWRDSDPFQIACRRDRTFYRVIELAEKAGLLIKKGKYLPGVINRRYKWNNTLWTLPQ